MKRRLLLLAALSLAATMILAAPAAAQGQNVTVYIRDFYFEPAQLQVEPGTTVTWVNEGAAPHTVTANDGAYDSGWLYPGQSYSWTYANPGTYGYYCAIHPSMTASVTVGGGGGWSGFAQQTPAATQATGTGAQQPQLASTGGPSLLAPLAGLVVVGSGVLAAAWAIRRRAS
jgi:plastocyanin